MANQKDPFYPIIYVRGYAMTQGAIDETATDPFCGFNVGSTVYRAAAESDKPPRKYIFESPLVRLASEFQYKDVYENGLDIMDPGWAGTIPTKAIVIYRYYDEASTLLGKGETPPMETFAKGLSDLVLRLRDLVCQNPANAIAPNDFRCYLVAHSMGGLVCRAFLQNPTLGDDAARRCVDKFFTYATPHNGIDVAGMNVPAWLSANDISNFNRDRMAGYLNVAAVYKATGRVDWLPESAFPSEKVFCLIGTNRSDYEVAMGLSRTFVGHGSDGLVRVENASVWGVDGQGNFSAPSATAYVYRSHSGYFGIVNAEESYQNLTRFLFGDIRVDLWVDVEDIRLPAEVKQKEDAGKEVNAMYQFEALASPRGKLWYLTRRVSEEDSVALLSHKDWKAASGTGKKSIYLSTVFLANRQKVNPAGPSLAYSVTFGVRVPDYEVDQTLWPDEHYEGCYLFRDAVVIELTPPQQAGDPWQVKYDWQSTNVGKATTPLAVNWLLTGKVELPIPFDSGTTPGITGTLRFVASRWNT